MKTSINNHVSLQEAVKLFRENGIEVSYKTLIRMVSSNPPELPATRFGKRWYIPLLNINKILHKNGNTLYRQLEQLPN